MTDGMTRLWFTPTRGAQQLAVAVGCRRDLLDQVTKALVVVSSLELYETHRAAARSSTLVHLQNTGAAFSFLADASGWQRWFFIVLARGRQRRAR